MTEEARKRAVYLSVRRPGHPLANLADRVITHRLVLWEKLNGRSAPCHWCGKKLYWMLKGPQELVADHIDGDTYNNDPENIVPSCRNCNGNRTRPSSRIWCDWCGAQVIGRKEGRFCGHRCAMLWRWEDARQRKAEELRAGDADSGAGGDVGGDHHRGVGGDVVADQEV